MLWTEVMRTIESFLYWSDIWVLEMITAAWKNIEIKCSAGESVMVLRQVKVFAEAHGQRGHSPGFSCEDQDEEDSQRLSPGHLPVSSLRLPLSMSSPKEGLLMTELG